jgi:hypothetical protein
LGAKAVYKKSDCAATKRQTCTLEGNTEEEKSGFDVVFFKIKYPRISWEIGWW